MPFHILFGFLNNFFKWAVCIPDRYYLHWCSLQICVQVTRKGGGGTNFRILDPPLAYWIVPIRFAVHKAMNRWAENIQECHLVDYPMTSVKISGERGCWEMRDFPTPCDPHSQGSWDKSKNPWYPSRNCTIPNEATARAIGTTRPVASWFLGPNSCLIGNHAISQQAWVLAVKFCTTPQHHLQIDAIAQVPFRLIKRLQSRVRTSC